VILRVAVSEALQVRAWSDLGATATTLATTAVGFLGGIVTALLTQFVQLKQSERGKN